MGLAVAPNHAWTAGKFAMVQSAEGFMHGYAIVKKHQNSRRFARLFGSTCALEYMVRLRGAAPRLLQTDALRSS